MRNLYCCNHTESLLNSLEYFLYIRVVRTPTKSHAPQLFKVNSSTLLLPYLIISISKTISVSLYRR